ncbi:MAG TPA: PAS domain S-box protein [Candidatus Limnocylindrales bacterium]|jgi:PAS domain S-box-containing protein|nr:PAS domain S-box protein [Candidatus Limnocylindrales bacterium]
MESPAPHYREAEFFRISVSITQILAESTDSNECTFAITSLLGISFGWDIGFLWVVDDATLHLRCNSAWNSVNAAQFESVSRSRTFGPGEGLPGRAWLERQTVWLNDLRSEMNFPRNSVAQLEGVRSGVAFPLYAQSGVLGVLELFSREQRDQDSQLANFFYYAGGQIGVFLERARIKSEMKSLDAELRLLASGSADAVLTIDENSTVLYANPKVLEVFGYQPEELIGQNLTMLIPEPLRGHHHAGLKHYRETGKRRIPWEGVGLTAKHKDGREIPVEISFGEFSRQGRRIFTGFARLKTKTSAAGQAMS